MALDIKNFKKKSITAVVSVTTQNVEFLKFWKVGHLVINELDLPDTNLLKYFDQTNEFI